MTRLRCLNLWTVEGIGVQCTQLEGHKGHHTHHGIYRDADGEAAEHPTTLRCEFGIAGWGQCVRPTNHPDEHGTGSHGLLPTMRDAPEEDDGVAPIAGIEGGPDDVVAVHDVTVRMPVGMTAAETAGFVHAAITRAMEAQEWIGEPAVLFRRNGEGTPIIMFSEGIHDPYIGELPHGLTEHGPDTSPNMEEMLAAARADRDRYERAWTTALDDKTQAECAARAAHERAEWALSQMQDRTPDAATGEQTIQVSAPPGATVTVTVETANPEPCGERVLGAWCPPCEQPAGHQGDHSADSDLGLLRWPNRVQG